MDKRAGKGGPGKWIRGIAIALIAAVLLGCLALGGANLIVITRSSPTILPPQEAARQTADCILVLGAGLKEDGTPCDMLRERLDAAMALYEAGASDKLLMSGGGREAQAMKDYAVNAGAKEQDVVTDSEGYSTFDSLYRAKNAYQAERIFVVTQPYHLYRAVYVGNAVGLECLGVRLDEITYEKMGWYKLREFLARAKDLARVKGKKLPAYQGEVLPIGG